MFSIITRIILDNVEFDTAAGCWLWSAAFSPKGYGRLSIMGQPVFAHRLSYENFVGPTDELSVLHKCHVRCCVNPDHLYLGVNRDNVDDRLRRFGCDPSRRRDIISLAPKRKYKAREVRGRTSPRHGIQHVLQPDQVRAIRRSAKSGVDLAKEFGVSTASISKIRNRRLWSTLPD